MAVVMSGQRRFIPIIRSYEAYPSSFLDTATGEVCMEDLSISSIELCMGRTRFKPVKLLTAGETAHD